MKIAISAETTLDMPLEMREQYDVHVIPYGIVLGGEEFFDGKYSTEEIFEKVKEGSMAKGDVLGTARIAGIMAAKKTFELIPMCHLLMLTKCKVDFEMLEETKEIKAVCLVKTTGKTGVEMEALTGVQIALLTIYDMCKAIDKHMVMSEIHLVEKTGGKSGDFVWKES